MKTSKAARRQQPHGGHYSREGDYESVGLSLNHVVELNEKNTTLNLAVAYTYDKSPAPPTCRARLFAFSPALP